MHVNAGKRVGYGLFKAFLSSLRQVVLSSNNPAKLCALMMGGLKDISLVHCELVGALLCGNQQNALNMMCGCRNVLLQTSGVKDGWLASARAASNCLSKAKKASTICTSLREVDNCLSLSAPL